MSREGLVKSGKKYGTILSGISMFSITLWYLIKRRTLATDRGFKERVREDMLIRLLDAFVWRNHGVSVHLGDIIDLRRNNHQTDKKRINLDLLTCKE